MQRFMSLALIPEADLPLRRLLYTAVAAVTTAGLYYFLKRRGERSVMDLESPTPTEIAVPEVTLDELEGRYEQAVKVNAELQKDLHRVKSEFRLLQTSSRQKEFELVRVKHQCSTVVEDWQRFPESHSTVMEKWGKMTELLKRFKHQLHDLVHEKARHSILKIKYKELMELAAEPQKELMIAEASLSDAENKFEMEVTLNNLARKENSELISNSDMLQDHVYALEKELSKICCKHKKLLKDQQVETDYRILQAQYKVIEKQRDELLKEEKYMLLMSQVNTLQDSVRNLEKELHETNRTYVELRKKRDQEQEERSFLTCQTQEMRETVKKCEELLKKLHQTSQSKTPEEPTVTEKTSTVTVSVTL